MEKLGIACIVLGSVAGAQVLQRSSVSTAGAQADRPSFDPSVSADGRFVAFSSDATTLVAGDTNGSRDIFVRDRWLGTTLRVSVDSNGGQGDADSEFPSISADGRFVAFASRATNLVPGDGNAAEDVFVHDVLTGATERASVDSAGVEGLSSSSLPVISGDGRCVAFVSWASNLVTGDTNQQPDIFVRDRQLGTTEAVSVGASGLPGNSSSGGNEVSAAISADGRYVAFLSSASDLVPGDTNGTRDVFVRDRQLGTTERVSVDSGGAQVTGQFNSPSISADGRYVAFSSSASSLVANDTNGFQDVFVHDRSSGATERVSVDSTGSQANGSSFSVSISGDGRFAAFSSSATNLVTADSNGFGDVFLRDRLLDITERVSVSSLGAQANGSSDDPSISSDARCIAFDSSAGNLVPDDTNLFLDVFAQDRHPSGYASMCAPGLAGVRACPCSNPPAGPDRGCDNSSATGGAAIRATGAAYLSMDTLVFTTSDERASPLSIVLQGNGQIAGGVAYGQGVRCVGGTIIRRLYIRTASGGSIRAPDLDAGDPTVSARSAAKGDVIHAGENRYYLVYYRDPSVLGGCPASHTFNATQTAQITWLP